jgi:hypothetical protein
VSFRKLNSDLLALSASWSVVQSVNCSVGQLPKFLDIQILGTSGIFYEIYFDNMNWIELSDSNAKKLHKLQLFLMLPISHFDLLAEVEGIQF